MNFQDYEFLKFERAGNGVLVMTLNRPQAANAMTPRMHWEVSRVWTAIGDDPETRVVVVTGAGKGFCSGSDMRLSNHDEYTFEQQAATLKEATDLVTNMINLDKPIISAINGVAVGAGLAVALCADISIMAENARFMDGHVRLGAAAGDHSVIIWPLLCGMAKAKYYLLTSDFIDGKEAERIGLVSLCVPAEQLMPKALEVAHRLGSSSQLAIRWTKRSLNHWLRQVQPAFEHSLALEMLNFFGQDVREGVNAVRDKREPKFPSGQN